MLTKIKDLEGFSGCKIILYHNGNIYFVRKISKSVEYNERLRNQMLKQKFFLENLANRKLTVPKVLNEGYINGLFFFDMEYIQGTNLIDYIIDADKDELLGISDNLCSMISLMKKTERPEKPEIITEKINKKIEEIQSKIYHKEGNILLEELKKSAMDLEAKKILQTFCHGDLTMENIIYSPMKEKYYFIDLLDSFVEHYWFDITKLFQDVEGHWYKFRNPSINLNNTVPKMKFISSFLHQNLIISEDFYRQNHHFLLALNFARILPYCNEKNNPYVIRIMRKSMDKFKERL